MLVQDIILPQIPANTNGPLRIKCSYPLFFPARVKVLGPAVPTMDLAPARS